ncbi:MAG: fused MFS/spermidine synthase [Solirubrobacteraceae bacterium]|nr:fused MFS/spermidine synthase [Solirubrobacteraceae bacterium]
MRTRSARSARVLTPARARRLSLPAVRRVPSVPLELVVGVVGVATLGAEIAAARLLAPYFGASTIIWANTIGVVLVALSIGYWLGGRRADRDPTPEGLYKIVLVGGVLVGVVPFVSGPFLDAAVEALDSISAGAFAGSLIAVLVLVAIPVLVLGMVAPYAIRLAVDDVSTAGTVAGRLYAVSTVGSLAGTFLSALLFIPLLGTRRTFLVYAIMLAVTAVVGLARARWVVVPVVLAGLMAVPVGIVKADAGPGRVIYDADTEYQYARVVERPSGERWLELNEGQAIHSVWKPGTVLTDNYWDDFLIVPFAIRETPPRSVAILGNAAGTTARAYGTLFPKTHVDGVEIDGELTEIGREYFDLAGPNLRTFTADARPFLRRTNDRYDAIFVDAYRQPYIPFYLTTREFFELVHDRLNPGGMVLINVGHPEGDDELEKVLTATVGEAFRTVARDPSEDTNTVLIGTDGDVSAARLRTVIPRLPVDLQPRARDVARRLAPGLPGGDVYTDDKAPVEWLVDTSIVKFAASGDAD